MRRWLLAAAVIGHSVAWVEAQQAPQPFELQEIVEFIGDAKLTTARMTAAVARAGVAFETAEDAKMQISQAWKRAGRAEGELIDLLFATRDNCVPCQKTDGPPLTLEEVKVMVGGANGPGWRVWALPAKRGLAFAMTAEAELALRRAGANNDVIAHLMKYAAAAKPADSEAAPSTENRFTEAPARTGLRTRTSIERQATPPVTGRPLKCKASKRVPPDETGELEIEARVTGYVELWFAGRDLYYDERSGKAPNLSGCEYTDGFPNLGLGEIRILHVKNEKGRAPQYKVEYGDSGSRTRLVLKLGDGGGGATNYHFTIRWRVGMQRSSKGRERH